MILADIVPIKNQTRPTFKKSDVDGLMKVRAGVNGIDAALAVLRPGYYYGNSEEKAVRGLDEAKKVVLEKFANERNTVFKKYKALPKAAILSDNDPFALLQKVPCIDVADLRQIADDFGFILLPFAYLSQDAYVKERSTVVEAITQFNQRMGGELNQQVYVLCPAQYYDIEKHIETKSMDDQSIYSARTIAPAFLSINLTLPALRSLYKNLNQLKEETNRRFGHVFTEIASMKERIQELGEQLAQQQQQILIEKAARQQMIVEAQLRAAQAIPYDPLMFAIPDKENITKTKCQAIVGPCWGPEFDDIIASVLNYKKIDGQKEKLTGFIKQWATFRN